MNKKTFICVVISWAFLALAFTAWCFESETLMQAFMGCGFGSLLFDLFGK